MPALLLPPLLLLAGAAALRTVPPAVPEPDRAALVDSANELAAEPDYEAAEAESVAVPRLSTFRRVWRRRYELETRLWEPLPSSVQLVMGVMTIAGMTGHRDVVRETWAKQTGVCYWSKRQKSGCSVYLAFVMGKRNPQRWEVPAPLLTEAHREPGAFVLDIEENVHGGKSQAWFAAALAGFPWATHFGKVDVDTYPFLHKLVLRLAANRSCVGAESPFEFVGRAGTWGLQEPGRPAFGAACPSADCLGQFRAPWDEAHRGQPFRYLAGEMYAMSRPLAEAVTWTQKRGYEDVVVSSLVEEAARRNGSCVAVRCLDASVRGLARVDAAFANDLSAGFEGA